MAKTDTQTQLDPSAIKGKAMTDKRLQAAARNIQREEVEDRCQKHRSSGDMTLDLCACAEGPPLVLEHADLLPQVRVLGLIRHHERAGRTSNGLSSSMNGAQLLQGQIALQLPDSRRNQRLGLRAPDAL
eukprot:CAMPEP_0183456440 /NCGR_PEP_ID=MMETSP0370-20130417/129012_1 /TAXON_ID=268820 /ORGANISM="Peridinium aciculiferum, Strain PAER-2" /LENGTH=128 /DNA_ID=CAMNT_0025648083 /DNA_START=24 /DNA_END=407 /DNA_ORIENTATION=+